MAKTKTKPKPKSSSLLGQAQAEKDVQYGPQFDAAQNLLGEAGKTLKSDIETAKNNAAAVTSMAEAEKAPTIDRYKGAQDRATGFQDLTAKALAGVGGNAGDIFRGAIGGEQAAQKQRLDSAGTRASTELSDRQQSALSGRIAAQNQARSDYRQTKDSLTGQIQSLLGRKQADVMARFGQLVESDANRQKDIDIAGIGAKARTDAAGIGATTRANAKADADAARGREKEEKRVGDIHKSTGQLKQTVSNIIDRWEQLAGASLPKENPRFDSKSPVSDNNKPYLNAQGNPVEEPGHAVQIKPNATAIRNQIISEGKGKIDEGLVHVALTLRGPDKALDQKAINYIQANGDWRIPREWLRQASVHPGVVKAPSSVRGQSRPN
jgi:hypothetical protein